MRIRNALSALLILGLAGFRADAQNLLTAQEWRSDLQYLAAQILKVHPGAFHQLTEQEFRSAVADLDSRVPRLSDTEVEVELIRLVAALGEGHSRISLPGLPDAMSDVADITPYKDPRLAFHRLPLELYRFADGLYVVAATAKWQSLVGSKVVDIGGHSAESLQQALRPLINRDNNMGAKLIAPQLMVVPEVLHGLHLIADPSWVRVVVQPAAGKAVSMDLPPLAAGEQPQWHRSLQAQRPAYLRRNDENFWAEYLQESRLGYVRINVLQDSRAESVTAFARELGELLESHPQERFVVDFRGCRGGDNQKFRALLLGFIRSASLDRLGNFFVIMDRATFSAAVNAVSDLERLTNVILVGEPTAGAPGSWGDAHRIVLPNSGLIARISTIYWSDWEPNASRPWIAPDISTELTSGDYFAGHDPSLQAVIEFSRAGGFENVLASLVRLGTGIGTVERLYYQRKTDPLWVSESTEQAMQHIGVQLLGMKSYRDALIVFAINHQDYPDSVVTALQAVQAAQAASPGEAGLHDLARSLRQLQVRQ
jgi:hypothetical protein